MDSLIRVTKMDVSIFECPDEVHLNEEFDYFIFDQSNLMICSVTSAITLVEYLRQKEGKRCEKLSVGFLYHNAVLLNNEPKIAIKYGLKATSVLYAILKYGTCSNDKWDKLDAMTNPSDEAIIESLSRIKHANIENIEQCIETIRYIIGFCRRPIVATFNIYDRSFYNRSTSYNIIHKPLDSQSVIDKHSIVLVGYSNTEKCLFFQNSYGKEWGLGGFGRISYDYIPFFGIMYSMDESCIKSEDS